MNKRSVWPVLLLLLLVGSNAYWLFLHAPEASSNMASGTARSVDDANIEGASDIDKPVIPEGDSVPEPTINPPQPPEQSQPDPPERREPTIYEAVEVKSANSPDAPELIRKAVDLIDSSEPFALDKTGEKKVSKIALTRENYPVRWGGLRAPKISKESSNPKRDWERAVEEYKEDPLVEDNGFLVGRVVKNVDEPSEEDAGLNMEEFNFSRGAIVTADPESKFRRAVVGANGYFILALNKIEKKNLTSSRGLKIYVQRVGYSILGKVFEHEPIILKGEKTIHKIKMTPVRRLIIELRLPEKFQKGGQVWIETSPSQTGSAWDDTTYLQTYISPDNPVFVALPSRGEVIRIGGWGADWHTKGVQKLRLKTVSFSRVILKVEEAFMREYSGSIVENIKVVNEADSAETKDVLASTKARIANEAIGVVDYSNTISGFRISDAITEKTLGFTVSYRHGRELKFFPNSRDIAGENGKLRLYFSFWVYDVEIDFNDDMRDKNYLRLRNYPKHFALKKSNSKDRRVIGVFPYLIDNLHAYASSSGNYSRGSNLYISNRNDLNDFNKRSVTLKYKKVR